MKKQRKPVVILDKFVPAESVHYCHELLYRYGFKLRITKSRKTKLGDYRFLASEKKHLITINHDLNPYQFLITYIHEVAHLVTFERYQNQVRPHGEEWKHNFKYLLNPMIEIGVFPHDLTLAIEKYMSNPKASSCADPYLFRALSNYDQKIDGELLLSEIDPGGVFQFNDRLFQKEEKKRTRSICLELKTGKKYLIPEIATVKVK